MLSFSRFQAPKPGEATRAHLVIFTSRGVAWAGALRSEVQRKFSAGSEVQRKFSARSALNQKFSASSAQVQRMR